MDITEHARVIQSAINAAADDGYELDNGSGYPLNFVELNTITNGAITGTLPYVEISIPCTFA